MYHLFLRLRVNMICRLKKKGLRNGHNQRGGGGGLGARSTRKRGSLRCGSGKKGGLYRRPNMYWTYMRVPPHIKLDYRQVWDMNFTLGLESSYLWKKVYVLRHKMITVSKYYPGKIF